MFTKLLSLLKPTTRPQAAKSLAAGIERARSLHRQGMLEAAATLYLELIEAHPDAAAGHYGRANVLKDQGQLEGAMAAYDVAIRLQPDFAHAFCNRAVVLGLLHKSTEALDSYDRALALDATDALAHCNRGILLNGLGDQTAALASFDLAIANRADFFPAHFQRGAILQERREWDAALESYNRAAVINPGDVATLYNRATVQRQLQQWEAALASYDRAIALNPGLVHAHSGRADVLQELNRLPAALDASQRAIDLNDQDAKAYNNRGVVLHKMRRFDLALASYDQAIDRMPGYAEAHFNRGTALSELGEYAAACAGFDAAISANPRYAEAYVNRGNALEATSRLTEALDSYHQALVIDSQLPEGHYNLALASLKLGDFATGWPEYEWRWLAKNTPTFTEKRKFAQPLWLGQTPIAGRTILLYGEQGFGDAMQFLRYVESVAALGARVIVEVPANLVILCRTLRGVAQVVPYGGPLPPFDLQCPLMSLALAFSTTLTTIPAATGYFRADPGKAAAWRERLRTQGKPLIGLTWSGNRAPGMYRKRHFSLARLLPHLSDDCRYVCLQTDIAEVDRETLSDNPRILSTADDIKDFSDTAALCEVTDLVITVDTSVAHLSGALGRPTWVLLAYSADWRWLVGRDDSPWYSTMRLYRQNSPGDWDEVFARVAADLRSEFGSRCVT